MSALPKDAQALLDSLPGKRITMDVVLQRAMQASDSFRAVKATLPTIDAPYLRSRAPLDVNVFARARRDLNRNEPQSPFQPNKFFATTVSIGGNSYLPSGTAFSAELLRGQTELGFLTVPPLSYYETRGAFTLTQNLWKDALGYGTRRNTRAGELLRDAAKEGFKEQVEDWALTLVQIYYGAWLAQARTKAAEANTNRRRRLVDITGIKMSRGTAERPDALQVKSALLSSRVQQAEADQALGDRWRGLVTSLKLPEAWLKIDPKEIPIELDSPVDEALAACGARAGGAPVESATSRKFALQAEAARLSAEAAKNAVAPDVELAGSLVTNGIDLASATTAFTEARTLQHPAWVLGLTVTVPLGQYAERAAAHEAVASQDRLESLASQSADDLRLDWMNACRDLRRLQDSYRLLSDAFDSQSLRARLEEERFRIGRTTTLGVIQSGDDATLAEWTLRGAEVDRRVAAWRVRRLAGRIEAYLEKLAESAQ